MFRLFADLIAFHLDACSKWQRARPDLISERERRELREQFMAVLGHDLRNPLAAIARPARSSWSGRPLDDRDAESSADPEAIDRMAALIDNVLDLTRGRLGDGLSVRRDTEKPLTPVLDHVVDGAGRGLAEPRHRQRVRPDPSGRGAIPCGSASFCRTSSPTR